MFRPASAVRGISRLSGIAGRCEPIAKLSPVSCSIRSLGKISEAVSTKILQRRVVVSSRRIRLRIVDPEAAPFLSRLNCGAPTSADAIDPFKGGGIVADFFWLELMKATFRTEHKIRSAVVERVGAIFPENANTSRWI